MKVKKNRSKGKKQLQKAIEYVMISSVPEKGIHLWGCSAVGSAFGSHPRGRGFESLQVHHYASVVQLDRASDSGSECWGFESLRAYHGKSLETKGFQGFFFFV